MRRKRILGCMCFALVTTLILVAQPVSARWVLIAEADGDTSVNGAGCSSNVDGEVKNPARAGDTATAFFHISWTDDRSGSPPSATHYFNMTVTYSRYTGDVYADKTVYTDPDDEGSDILNITIPSVEYPSTIGVTWYASSYYPGIPPCFAEDSDWVLVYVSA